MRTFFALITLMLLALPAAAMTGDGCGAGECTSCHSLSKEEVKALLPGIQGEVVKVELAEVPGLWVVEIDMNGKKVPAYVDFSKSYLIEGRITRLKDRSDITKQRFFKSNPVDVSTIPLEDALLLGSADAATKVIVFTDPQCPYCTRLHEELKEVVRLDSGIAFYIKLLPLTKIHPKAYGIAKSIVCSKSLQMLDDSLAGKEVPALPCEAPAVDETMKLAPVISIISMSL